ncbi:MAG: tripartite tricarboxylate transporter TctB family protein [Candidatus Accumulibacter sp.]|jgi:membrane protein implicated in regulation of membrane protease activity|nr:tripartite tricarboxylate transporter TctB family protein [Accumulibacter sp.]
MKSKRQPGTVNTDFWGAGLMFFFAIGFWSQMDPDFTRYGAYFPNRLIPCLFILGALLLIKGFVKPAYLPSFWKAMNATMIFTIVTGVVWVFTLEWLGFALSSTLAILALLIRFRRESLKQPAQLAKYLAIALGEVGFIYLVFEKWLYVPLPVGSLWS